MLTILTLVLAVIAISSVVYVVTRKPSKTKTNSNTPDSDLFTLVIEPTLEAVDLKKAKKKKAVKKATKSKKAAKAKK